MTEIIPLDRARGARANPDAQNRRTDSRRAIYVVFTDIENTLRAVRLAARLAPAFGDRVVVVHFRPLDFGAPIEAPGGISPAETESFRQRLAEPGCDVEISVCVCRDARQALPSVIDAHALVLVGGRRHWWRTAAERWRRTLERAGYAVVVVTDTNEAGQRDG